MSTLGKKTLRQLRAILEPLNYGHLVAEIDRALAPNRKLIAYRKARDAKKKQKWASKAEETAAIYALVEARAGGACECCGYSFTALNPPHMDHERGRGHARQTVENCWMLRFDCHQAKGANRPSEESWLRSFITHCERHGYRAEKKRAEDRLHFVQVKTPVQTSAQGAL